MSEKLAAVILAAGQGHAVGQGVTVTAVKAPHRDEYADTMGYLISGPHRGRLLNYAQRLPMQSITPTSAE